MIEKPIKKIPTDPLSSEKVDVETKNFFIDDNYSDLYKEVRFFP